MHACFGMSLTESDKCILAVGTYCSELSWISLIVSGFCSPTNIFVAGSCNLLLDPPITCFVLLSSTDKQGSSATKRITAKSAEKYFWNPGAFNEIHFNGQNAFFSGFHDKKKQLVGFLVSNILSEFTDKRLEYPQ